MTPTAALVALLDADATLRGLAPGGVWLDVAPDVNEKGTDGTPLAPRPVIVVGLDPSSLVEGGMCGSDSWDYRYLWMVEGTQDQSDAIRLAAARVKALVHDVRWDGGAGQKVLRSVVSAKTERAYVDGQTRLHAMGGRLDVLADDL